MTIDQIIEREFACLKEGLVPYFDGKKLRSLLEEAVAPYKKDAERLSHVEHHSRARSLKMDGNHNGWFVDSRCFGSGRDFREAIDAAMKEAK